MASLDRSMLLVLTRSCDIVLTTCRDLKFENILVCCLMREREGEGEGDINEY
jgi:hypothetical protein